MTKYRQRIYSFSLDCHSHLGWHLVSELFFPRSDLLLYSDLSSDYASFKANY